MKYLSIFFPYTYKSTINFVYVAVSSIVVSTVFYICVCVRACVCVCDVMKRICDIDLK